MGPVGTHPFGQQKLAKSASPLALIQTTRQAPLHSAIHRENRYQACLDSSQGICPGSHCIPGLLPDNKMYCFPGAMVILFFLGQTWPKTSTMENISIAIIIKIRNLTFMLYSPCHVKFD